jgi:hypothetical protein
VLRDHLIRAILPNNMIMPRLRPQRATQTIPAAHYTVAKQRHCTCPVIRSTALDPNPA